MQIAIAPGRQLFVDIEGAGWVPDGARLRQKPTLVLLHGGPGFDHSSFKPLFSQLADVAQLVYVDHRGHGRSSPCPPEECTLDTLADDVVRLCAVLGIERPVVLGQSFGGFVAQRYLARHPGHAARVVLSSTSPALNLGRKLAMFERLGGAEARALAQAFWQQPRPDTWAPYQRVCVPLYNTRPGDPQARQRTLYKFEILYHSASGEQQTMDLLPGLARAQCPVLVLAGDQDPVCPLADAQDIAAALPPHLVQFERFADAGHGVWRDQPQAAMAVLRRFVVGADPGG